MKQIVSSIILILSSISTSICSIWAVVEFILYLAKDRPFNWLSIWFFVLSVVLVVVFTILTAYYNTRRPAARSGFEEKVNSKSKFQQRLEEMAKKRQSEK